MSIKVVSLNSNKHFKSGVAELRKISKQHGTNSQEYRDALARITQVTIVTIASLTRNTK